MDIIAIRAFARGGNMNKKIVFLAAAVFLAVSAYCADKPASGKAPAAPAAAAPAAPGGPTVIKGTVYGMEVSGNGKSSQLVVELPKNEKGWRDRTKISMVGALLVKDNFLQKSPACINSGDPVVVESTATSTQVVTNKPIVGKTTITKTTTKVIIYLGQNAIDYPNVKYKDGKNN